MSKKEEILKIASKEFAKYGYKGISLETIAKKAGISKAAIYYHFANKAALFKEVIMPKLDELINKIQNCKSNNPKENLKCYIYSFSEIFLKYNCFASILAHEFVDGGRNLNEGIIKEMSKIFQKLISILEEGQKKEIFDIKNPFSIQLMIVSSLVMHQTTKELRQRVSKYLDTKVEANINDIANSLSKQILKAISKE